MKAVNIGASGPRVAFDLMSAREFDLVLMDV